MKEKITYDEICERFYEYFLESGMYLEKSDYNEEDISKFAERFGYEIIEE